MAMLVRFALSLAPMNRILTLLVLVACIALWSKCSTDFDVTGEHKEITTVYGLLDQSQSDQYIRIQRAYLNEEGSALDVAQNADSIYHADNMSVKLIRFDLNGNQQEEIQMNRVESDQSGVEKDSGIFASQPSYLYHTDQPIYEESIYELEIITPEGNVITAETTVVADFRIFTPQDMDSLNFNLNGDSTVQLRWRKDDTGFVYDAKMTMVYEEKEILNPDNKQTKSISDVIISGRREPDQNDIFVELFSVRNLLDFMNRNIEEDPTVQRRFLELQFNFVAATEDVYNFQLVNFAQFSVAAGQSRPQYSNLEGAIGVFSARYNSPLAGIGLQAGVVEQMSCSPITEHLNFKGHPGSLNYPDCPPQ